MKHKIIIEIDGVRHKLIKTRAEDPCKKCSLKSVCFNSDSGNLVILSQLLLQIQILCGAGKHETHFSKCKPGE